MDIKRYEISNEQWKQIKNLFPKAKTSSPPKDNKIMFNVIFDLHEVVLHGQLFQNVMFLIKPSIIIFTNSVMTVLFCVFLKF